MDIDEVIQLKASLKEEYEKRLVAIDMVIEMLAVKNGGIFTTVHGLPTDEDVGHNRDRPPKPNPGEVQIERKPHAKKGVFLRPVARAIIPQLPLRFTKEDVRALALQAEPKLTGKIKANALAGTMNTLVEEGLIERVTDAVGRKAATYRKVAMEEDIKFSDED